MFPRKILLDIIRYFRQPDGSPKSARQLLNITNANVMHLRTLQRVMSGETLDPGYTTLWILVKGFRIPPTLLFPDVPGAVTVQDWLHVWNRLSPRFQKDYMDNRYPLLPVSWDEYALLEHMRETPEDTIQVTPEESHFIMQLRDLHVTLAEREAMVQFYASLRRMQAPPDADQ